MMSNTETGDKKLDSCEDKGRLLNDLVERVGVSSVLNKSTSCYGKQFLLDGLKETCWNSDSGHKQWISLTFSEPVCISRLEIQFQGGFSGKDTSTFVLLGDSTDRIPIHPKDDNSLQIFTMSLREQFCEKLKIVFEGSTDFYGRVIVYTLNVYGIVK
ncbi:nuclear receptor 2C2-associated protein-like [Convolutriloba macropyga]|uniref:nuclear receptor 2C2-associated protein-like n=1 Tax=Convolutriloba macropyga TaxID=536237 RepID=UPI003F51EDBB